MKFKTIYSMEFTIVRLRSVDLCLILCFSRYLLTQDIRKFYIILYITIFISRYYLYSLILHITSHITIPGYGLILALTSLHIKYSVIVALIDLLIGHKVTVRTSNWSPYK